MTNGVLRSLHIVYDPGYTPVRWSRHTLAHRWHPTAWWVPCRVEGPLSGSARPGSSELFGGCRQAPAGGGQATSTRWRRTLGEGWAGWQWNSATVSRSLEWPRSRSPRWQRKRLWCLSRVAVFRSSWLIRRTRAMRAPESSGTGALHLPDLVQDLRYGFEQLVRTEGLEQHAFAPHDRLASGDEEHGHAGAHRPELPGELRSGHHRHVHVDDRERQHAAELADHPERRFPVLGLQHDEPRSLEGTGDHAAHRFLVIDEQYGSTWHGRDSSGVHR